MLKEILLVRKNYCEIINNLNSGINNYFIKYFLILNNNEMDLIDKYNALEELRDKNKIIVEIMTLADKLEVNDD